MTQDVDPSLPWNQGPPPELPPVEPPSAGLVVQLFIIPLVIVGVLVIGALLVYLPFGKLATAEQSASDYVRAIRTERTERQRFRAAFELASLIHNDAKLSQSAELAGELADLLADEIKNNAEPEIKEYLAHSLGAFQLAETAGSKAGDKPIAALVRCLDKDQTPAVRQAAATSLARMGARAEDGFHHPEAVAALAETSRDAETETRLRAVYALGFMAGPEAEQALLAKLEDEDRVVSYNVAIALARRDNDRALPLLTEMLDAKKLERVFSSLSVTERQTKIESVQLDVLRSLEHAQRGGKMDLSAKLRPEIKALERSPFAGVRSEAQIVLNNRVRQ